MKARITEIFQSIQGEGKYIGVKQVFVRFFGCNMHCFWCDTPDSIGDTTQQFEEKGLEDLIKDIKGLWDTSHSVSLTGGEPLLQEDLLKRLLPSLEDKGMPVYLETNGILFKELEGLIDWIDFIAMDIKLPSSTHCRSYWEEHKAFLNIARKKDVFVKTVVSNETQREDIETSAGLVAEIGTDIPFILQPNHFDMGSGIMKRCMTFQKDCQKSLNNVNIIPQMHKLMGVR